MMVKLIHNYLIKQGKTLAVAESCSGGVLSTLFTTIPNASQYFLGAIVAYSPLFKHKILHVANETLLENGAVSRETADEMILGLFKITGCDVALSITGIAGPSGGTAEKPVGTVFIGVGLVGKKPHIIECHFEGDREQVMYAAAVRAVEELAFILSLKA